jgi:putative ABC transport system substrate-binding protein
MGRPAGTSLALVITVLALFAAPLAAEAQQPPRVPKRGLLRVGSLPDANVAGFLQGLRDPGYVEGQNIVIEYRWAEGKLERLPTLASDLVRLKVEVIVTGGLEASLAAKTATRLIPIVAATGADPVSSGLVASLARPGGNITGLTVINVDLAGKRLELLKEAVPGASRVAVLRNRANGAHALLWTETQRAARSLSVQLQSHEVRGANEFERAFAAMARDRAGALLLAPDEMFWTYRGQIVDLAAKTRLPGMFDFKGFVDAGGLMAYGPNFPDMFRRAATYVDKILKGAKPGDLPVEQPTKFELLINLKTAKALGLTIPQSVLLRADEVIR